LDRVQYWKERQAKIQAKNKQLAEQAKSEAISIVEMLRGKFGITKAILFGSLVRGNFCEESDIDLAVSGLKKLDYFPALSAANRLTERWVDLKPIEDLEPHFRQKVIRTGECIYAADISESTERNCN
jgi:predicted nucleotidyltransferase